MLAVPAIRASFVSAPFALASSPSTFTYAAPVFGVVAARELLPRGYAKLAGDVSEGILASKSTSDLTDFLERNLANLTPRTATTALVRYGLLGGQFPGERDLQNRIAAILPSLVSQIPSMDADGKKMAEAMVAQFKAAGWKL
jgi:hypothetical protein